MSVSLGLVLGLGSQDAKSATVYFEHDDARYLNPQQQNGGASLVPDDPGPRAVPLVVFLHGTNPNGNLHLWLGGGGRDLRPVATRLYGNDKIRPFILAAPSQTRAAKHGSKLWKGFNLDAFVEDVARATDGRATIDRDWVVVMGHSGAGCNLRGGLTSELLSQGRVLPRSLIAVDPCMDAPMGEAFARRPARVPLWVMWQSARWKREPAAFKRAIDTNRPAARVDRIEELPAYGPDAHDSILPLALERAVRELFARRERHAGAS